MTIFMFSGQGSQYFQMGKELFDSDETFRGWMLRLDETARRTAGQSVIETLYSDAHGKGEPFDRTLLTHPAIFMVEYSLAQSLMHAGIRPEMVLGVSVGSFAAAAVAGCVDVDDALTAVIRQAMALEEWGEPGGMTAVLADPALFDQDFFRGRGELAAVNFSSHFVVSARRSELVAIEAVLKQRNVSHQRLPVSFPFHSQWMDKARPAFEPFMRSVRRTKARLPLVCCDRTTTLSDLSDSFFWDVVRHPIRFRETIARLEREGGRRYVDVGPAGTLATFLKYGLPESTKSSVYSILTPFGRDRKNLAAVSSSIGH
ncbi:MAG TPA: acyltransferase domain-containing protein [Thermoanaerobaculia bacterium]|nr:acyltransferase domain-containing protein [Thermoanaerobaculia bacterium]